MGDISTHLKDLNVEAQTASFPGQNRSWLFVVVVAITRNQSGSRSRFQISAEVNSGSPGCHLYVLCDNQFCLASSSE